MNKVKVNDKFEFDITVEADKLMVNQQEIVLDSIKLEDGHFSVIYQNKVFNLELLPPDSEDKQVNVKVNGNTYSVAVQDQYDLLLNQLGMDNLTINKVQQVKAPMPGLVLDILVNEGDFVQKGDSLLILEAMKMENIIKSPCDGQIKNIAIKKADTVEKNALLLAFE